MRRYSKYALLLAPVLVGFSGCAARPAWLGSSQATPTAANVAQGETNSSRTDRLLAAAEKYERDGKPEAAFRLYKHIVSQDPSHALARERMTALSPAKLANTQATIAATRKPEQAKEPLSTPDSTETQSSSTQVAVEESSKQLEKRTENVVAQTAVEISQSDKAEARIARKIPEQKPSQATPQDSAVVTTAAAKQASAVDWTASSDSTRKVDGQSESTPRSTNDSEFAWAFPQDASEKPSSSRAALGTQPDSQNQIAAAQAKPSDDRFLKPRQTSSDATSPVFAATSAAQSNQQQMSTETSTAGANPASNNGNLNEVDRLLAELGKPEFRPTQRAHTTTSPTDNSRVAQPTQKQNLGSENGKTQTGSGRSLALLDLGAHPQSQPTETKSQDFSADPQRPLKASGPWTTAVAPQNTLISRKDVDQQKVVHTEFRPTSVTQLCNETAPAELITLVGLLDSSEPNKRIAGLIELSLHGEEAQPVSPAVRALLEDENSLVRVHAVGTIRDIEGNQADVVNQLQQLLADSNPEVVRLAAYLLGQIGPKALPAVSELQKVMNDADGLSGLHAAEALSRLTPENDAPHLMLEQALQHGSREEQLFAAVSLGGAAPAGRDRAVKALKQALKHQDPDIRATAALSLGGLGKHAHAALPDLQNVADNDQAEVREAALTALACLGE